VPDWSELIGVSLYLWLRSMASTLERSSDSKLLQHRNVSININVSIYLQHRNISIIY